MALVNSLPFSVVVHGKPISELPKGLFIPEEPMQVHIDSFTGPLDLLLYLVRKNKIDILHLPVAIIAVQYNKFIDKMQSSQFSNIGEYLAMSTYLVELKSRLLNPYYKISNEENETDPRAELSHMLIVYDAYQKAAQWLDSNKLVDRDVMLPEVSFQFSGQMPQQLEIHINQLLESLTSILQRKYHSQKLKINTPATIEVEHKISYIVNELVAKGVASFSSLCIKQEGRQGVIATFLAVLELVFEAKIKLVQSSELQLRLA